MVTKQIKENQTSVNTDTSVLQVLSAQEIGTTAVTKSPEVGFAIYVRSLMQNWRQGTVGCKTRAEVAFANRKPWKQKGTGRARAGSARSPLWRKGGIIFGPQPRTRTLKLNKQTRKSVIQAFFAKFAENNAVYALDWQVEGTAPSTRAFYNVLQSVQLTQKRIALFVDRDDILGWASARNLTNIQLFSFDDINAYDLAQVDCLLVFKKDISNFKQMVSKWN